MDSPESSEVERIRRVYETYDQMRWNEAKWSSSNPGNEAILAERESKLLRLLESSQMLPLATKRILEIGCGTGNVIKRLVQLGATEEYCHGIDVLEDRIVQAHSSNPKAHFQVGTAEKLPYENHSFHLLLAFTVFSSILDNQMRSAIASQMDRVLARGGAILWYDLLRSNPNNRNVRGLPRSEIKGLFPGYAGEGLTLTLLPPLARRLGPLTPYFYGPLSKVPWLRTHLVWILKKNR